MKPKLGICIALLDTGRRCHRPAVRVTQYHGDNELYDYSYPWPQWVRAELCDRHSEAPRKREMREEGR